jgi:hypothetical protein
MTTNQPIHVSSALEELAESAADMEVTLPGRKSGGTSTVREQVTEDVMLPTRTESQVLEAAPRVIIKFLPTAARALGPLMMIMDAALQWQEMQKVIEQQRSKLAT